MERGYRSLCIGNAYLIMAWNIAPTQIQWNVHCTEFSFQSSVPSYWCTWDSQQIKFLRQVPRENGCWFSCAGFLTELEDMSVQLNSKQMQLWIHQRIRKRTFLFFFLSLPPVSLPPSPPPSLSHSTIFDSCRLPGHIPTVFLARYYRSGSLMLTSLSWKWPAKVSQLAK